MKQENQNNSTELVFILDRSGSMEGLEKDTIGGFNSMIEKQKQLEGQCYVSTFLFDQDSTLLHDRLPLQQVEKMTQEQYWVRGCTALLDAVAKGITHVDTIHKYIRQKDVPSHTLFVITTDGQENASTQYSAEQVKRLIEQKKELGWEFLFLGANIDAVATAGNLGIQEDHAVNFHCDSKGTQLNYQAVSQAVCAMRQGAPINRSWKNEIEKDFKKRKNQR